MILRRKFLEQSQPVNVSAHFGLTCMSVGTASKGKRMWFSFPYIKYETIIVPDADEGCERLAHTRSLSIWEAPLPPPWLSLDFLILLQWQLCEDPSVACRPWSRRSQLCFQLSETEMTRKAVSSSLVVRALIFMSVDYSISSRYCRWPILLISWRRYDG